MLQIKDLRVKYGNVEAIHGISLSVREGEIVSILGANGAGKSTTLLAISGIIKREGSISFKGDETSKLPAHAIVKKGIIHAPEGRRIFGTLTVEENLNMGAFVRKDSEIEKTRKWVYELFPVLAERKHQFGGTLSGGEQQMLCIGRALMANPELLLLDEPSLGLAPLFVKTIFHTIREINEAGLTVLIVEQNAKAALKLAHRGYIMENGRIVLEGIASTLLSNPAVQNAYLGGSS
ncbi:MAG: branched-chain amino acid transport system ATP-binding protein, livF [Syntrophus sp. SKADARSKE-3]|nr:branched-chain amino acid transport system ATP-binding protein, livF [Syntrophus sp. SKADARSKE-3]